MSLKAIDLVKRYGGRRVVDGVSLSVSRGQIVGLLGPNGAGKTTTFHLITGLILPERGQILLGDEPITRLPFYQRARRGLYYLPQEPSAFRKLSVADNLRLVLAGKDDRLWRASQREEQVASLLERFHLAALADRRAGALSSGERRRLEIARALAGSPQYLLLDEPFSGVDPISVEELQGIIIGLKAEGIGVIITDHNVRETLKVTDYAYLINEGRLLLEGPPEEIVQDPLARKFYLGERFRL